MNHEELPTAKKSSQRISNKELKRHCEALSRVRSEYSADGIPASFQLRYEVALDLVDARAEAATLKQERDELVALVDSIREQVSTKFGRVAVWSEKGPVGTVMVEGQKVGSEDWTLLDLTRGKGEAALTERDARVRRDAFEEAAVHFAGRVEELWGTDDVVDELRRMAEEEK